MTAISWASILAGTVIILTRAPFILAPVATREFYLRLFSSNWRVRLFGLFPGVLGTAMVLASRGTEQMAGFLVLGFGGFLVLAAVFGFLLFTSVFKSLVHSVLEGMDELILRGVGVISVILGAFFIYLGIAVLR